MLKFHVALSTGLAMLVVAPALVFDDAELAALQNALANTGRALEVLKNIDKGAAADNAAAPGLIRSATEAPILEPRERDDLLMSLRNEVNLLQMELDSFESGQKIATDPGGMAVSDPAMSSLNDPRTVTTGLSESLRSVLSHAPDTRTEAAAPKSMETAQPMKHAGSAPEHMGYSADPLREARACYHAGRYDEGRKLLEPLHEDPSALYWKARCLEQLGELDEASAALQRVLELAPDSLEGRRAQTDIDFIDWKKKFVEKLPKGLREGGDRS